MKIEISPKTIEILRLIAKGHTYEQIVTLLSDCTYVDIFNAAQELIDIFDEANEKDNTERYAEIRKTHSRAYMS